MPLMDGYPPYEKKVACNRNAGFASAPTCLSGRLFLLPVFISFLSRVVCPVHPTHPPIRLSAPPPIILLLRRRRRRRHRLYSFRFRSLEAAAQGAPGIRKWWV